VVVLGGTGGGAPLLYTEKFMTYFRPTGTGSGENGVGQQPSGDNGHKGDEGDNDAMEKATGLLLLIPLVLGLGKVGHPPRYL